MVHLDNMILAQDDPFEFIYEAIGGTHGHALYEYLSDLYNQICVDYGHHPDDDFEKIIEKMIMMMEEDQ
jgi:hypothetical protein